MKKTFTFTAIAALFLVWLLQNTSCKKDSGPIIITPPIDTTKSPTPVFVSFANEIQPIFNNNCISCHNQDHVTGQDLRPGISYSKIVNVVSFGYAPALRVKPFDADGSVLWNKDAGTGVYGQQMPLGGFIQKFEMDLIKKWIIEGAKNN